LDGVLGELSSNSFDRPESNHDGIKRDVRQMFNDCGWFDAIRDRLGSFNRDTFAVMSSREDISGGR